MGRHVYVHQVLFVCPGYVRCGVFAFDPERSMCMSVSIIKLRLALFAHRVACQGDCGVTGCYQAAHSFPLLMHAAEPLLTVAGALMLLQGCFSLCSFLFFSSPLCWGFHSPPLGLSALSESFAGLIYLRMFGSMSEPCVRSSVETC